MNKIHSHQTRSLSKYPKYVLGKVSSLIRLEYSLGIHRSRRVFWALWSRQNALLTEGRENTTKINSWLRHAILRNILYWAFTVTTTTLSITTMPLLPEMSGQNTPCISRRLIYTVAHYCLAISLSSSAQRHAYRVVQKKNCTKFNAPSYFATGKFSLIIGRNWATPPCMWSWHFDSFEERLLIKTSQTEKHCVFGKNDTLKMAYVVWYFTNNWVYWLR